MDHAGYFFQGRAGLLHGCSLFAGPLGQLLAGLRDLVCRNKTVICPMRYIRSYVAEWND